MRQNKQLRLPCCCLCLLGLVFYVNGQNLSFTRPSAFSVARTDNAPVIVNFNNNYFISWKSAGKTGRVMYSSLGTQYGTAASAAAVEIPSGQTSFAPALRVFNNKLYLFWINADGKVSYAMSNPAAGLDGASVRELTATGDEKVSLGLTAAAAGNNLILASHGTSKDKLLYAVLQAGADGVLGATQWTEIQNEKSKNYPFAAALDASAARFCWRGKNDLIYYADYNADAKTWTPTQVKGPATTHVSPAIYHVWDSDQLFYVWRGNGADNRLYYKTAASKEVPTGNTVLPAYFATDYPVAIGKVDNNNFMLVFTGSDGLIYLSKFSSYRPSSWMAQYLRPAQSTKTLRDVVIPGSHDAGMSVLTATGGQQKGTINECNVLTQKLNVGQQLASGIRMFDLRAGTFNGKLYAKHCASDCMAEAIGGGYGESLQAVGTAIGTFLNENRQEIVVLSFSHFCEGETPVATLKSELVKWIGPERVYAANAKAIGDVPLKQLAGKVIISFEAETGDPKFPSCSIADKSPAFINFRRAYAATNELSRLTETEKTFFTGLQATLAKNDLVRLDWQLTQSSSEAPIICNDFEDEKMSPVISGVMLLANAVKKNKSIIDHSLEGNKSLPPTVNDWVKRGILNRENKPNVLYVDVAGPWITDYCIDLLSSGLYD